MNMIKNNNELKYPIHFIESINGKSVLFQYRGNIRIKEILDSISSDIHYYFGFPEIHLCNENRSAAIQEFHTETTTIKISRNLTSTMIKLEKMIFKNEYMVIIDNLEEVLVSPGSRARMLFLETLLLKSKENHGIVLSTYRLNAFDHIFEKKIIDKYDMIIDIDDEKLSITNMDETKSMYYIFSDTGISIRSKPANDMDKIKEIFRLTPEEKEELDKIVGKQIKDFDIS